PTSPPWIKSRRVVMRSTTPVPLRANSYPHSSANSDDCTEPLYNTTVAPTALNLAHLSAPSNPLYMLFCLVHVQVLRPTPTPRHSSPASTTIAGPDGRSR